MSKNSYGLFGVAWKFLESPPRPVLLAWICSGALAGLGLGLADALLLAFFEHRMFIDGLEMLYTGLWALGICGFLGLVVGLVIGGGVLGARAFVRRLSVSRPRVLLAFIFALLLLPIVAMALWQLSSGPRASAWSGRLPAVVLLSFLLSWVSGGAPVFIGAWAENKRWRRIVLVAGAALLAAAAVIVDKVVLVRLYPVFHMGLTLAALLLLTLSLRLAFEHPMSARSLGRTAILCALTGVLGVLSLWMVLHTENPRFVLTDRTASAADVLWLAGQFSSAPTRNDGGPMPSWSRGEDDLLPSETSLPVKPGASLFLVTVDAMRADRLALAGSVRRPMPHLDKLAQDSVVFTRAYTPSPNTSYAISSLLTGKYTRPLFNVPGAPVVHETWPEILSRFRYKTAAFFTNAIFFIDRSRFEPYARTSYGFSYRKVDYLVSARDRVAQAFEFFDQHQRDDASSPVFAWMHFFEAHEPYDPSCLRYGSENVDRYDCELSTVDDALALLFERIDRDYPDSVVIVTSDHGEEFGEHGGRYHGTTLYDEQVRVPLVMKVPGVEHRIVEVPVSLVDLLGTSLALLDIPVPARVRSRDLRHLFAGTSLHSDAMAYSEVGEEEMLVVGHHKLICPKNLRMCRLYDLDADPGEIRSVAEAHPELVQELSQRILAMRRSHAEAELRPVRTDDGLVGWPESIRRAMAGERSALETLLQLIANPVVPLEQRRKAAELVRGLWQADPVDGLPTPALDEDPLVACWLWLARLEHGDDEAADPTAEACSASDPAEGVRRAAAPALLRSGHPRGPEEVVSVVMDTTAPAEQRAANLELLAERRFRELAPIIEPLVNEYQLTLTAAKALGAYGKRTSVPVLIARFHRERFAERKAAVASALAEIGDVQAAAAIAIALFLPQGPPAGLLDALVKLVKPGARGKKLSLAEGGQVLLFSKPRLDAPIRVIKASNLRVVLRAKSAAEAGSLHISCGESFAVVPLGAQMDESFVDIGPCGSNKAPWATLTLSPSLADVEIEVQAMAAFPLP